ncbi:ketopantoate reductase family protein [Marinicrinis lubricantis]|uniref:2-dehydropantoate 2-reductase n=1 Tax=Marinicrinis lubricantis TaxID=2086470 RepID=A0ABW1IUQ8_9BACL
MIHVIGGGAIGMLYAARLASQNASQVLLAVRSMEQASYISEAGIRIEDEDAGSVVRLSSVPTDGAYIEKVMEQPPEWVLITVKQHHIQDQLLELFRKTAHPNSNWVWLQNGMRAMDVIQAQIPGMHWLAVTTEASLRLGIGHIKYTGRGRTSIGRSTAPLELSSNEKSRAFSLIEKLEKAGLRAALSNNIIEELWRKLTVNAIINPLTAILKIRNGSLLESDDLQRVMKQLYREVTAVAEAEYIHLPLNLWDYVEDVCKQTSQNYSSTLQDLMNGRPTELDWMNGFIIEKASEHGIEVPTHQMLYSLVKGLETVHTKPKSD